MSDDPEPVTLPLAASRALIAFAERIGQDPQALAVEAIERFLAEEEPIAEEVLRSLDDFQQGKSVSAEDAKRGFEKIIDRAQRKSA